MELYQLLAVVDRDREARLLWIYSECGTRACFSRPGRGTAGGEILQRYGLPATEKRVVSAVADARQADQIFRQARALMYMDIPGNGILAAIPLKSAGGRRSLEFLTASEIKGGLPSMDFEYELIVVILNEGFGDMVMDAARSAGAGGGTLLHAKGTGSGRGERFLKVSLADEKDMIYIVAHRDEKAQIMQAIMAQAGPGSRAGGICFSLPISRVMGLRDRSVDPVFPEGDAAPAAEQQ